MLNYHDYHKLQQKLSIKIVTLENNVSLLTDKIIWLEVYAPNFNSKKYLQKKRFSKSKTAPNQKAKSLQNHKAKSALIYIRADLSSHRSQSNFKDVADSLDKQINLIRNPT